MFLCSFLGFRGNRPTVGSVRLGTRAGAAGSLESRQETATLREESARERQRQREERWLFGLSPSLGHLFNFTLLYIYIHTQVYFHICIYILFLFFLFFLSFFLFCWGRGGGGGGIPVHECCDGLLYQLSASLGCIIFTGRDIWFAWVAAYAAGLCQLAVVSVVMSHWDEGN